MTRPQRPPELFLSLPHPCNYLPGRRSTSLFLDPRRKLDSETYAHFVRLGFRRSGDFVYRPHCGQCDACVPVRVSVARFRPNRSQRRIARRNRDLAVHAHPPVFSAEHFALYTRYQAARHPGGGMDDPDPEKYLGFLAANRIDTVFHEFRRTGQLLAVAVVDYLPDSLSAVYTFFEPSEARRSLGTYAVLWQIAEARRLGLRHVYLGYWIADCPKMSYKTAFAPLEGCRHGVWTPLEAR